MQCILLPTDGSECERAIHHGVELARAFAAKVVGVTVTLPLHSAVPRAMIPKNLAGIIHSETARLADERDDCACGWGAGGNCSAKQ